MTMLEQVQETTKEFLDLFDLGHYKEACQLAYDPEAIVQLPDKVLRGHHQILDFYCWGFPASAKLRLKMVCFRQIDDHQGLAVFEWSKVHMDQQSKCFTYGLISSTYILTSDGVKMTHQSFFVAADSLEKRLF